jgi:ribosomal protein S9
MKRKSSGMPEKAYDATIQAVAPQGLDGIAFTTSGGKGELDCRIEVTGVPSVKFFDVTVTASGGGSQQSASVKVDVSVEKFEKEDEEKKEEPTIYTLHLPTDHLTVDSQNPGTFTVTTMKRKGSGTAEKAYDATIQAVAPQDLDGIAFTTSGGKGELDCRIEVTGVPSVKSFDVTVTASGGGSQQSASVKVDVKAGSIKGRIKFT